VRPIEAAAGLRPRRETDDTLERLTEIGSARLSGPRDSRWVCVLCFETGRSLEAVYPAKHIGRALTAVLAKREAYIESRAVSVKGLVEIGLQGTHAGCAK